MGSKKRFKRGFRKKNKEGAGKKGQPLNYENIVKENEFFETYYKAQGIVPDEEWPSFMSHLRDELPSAFRINRCLMGQTQRLKELIQDKSFTDIVNPDGSRASAISPLPWDPEGLMFQLNYSRVEIRKSESLQRLHSFLQFESENGYITRQESVSMLPPLVLDVQSHHKVLDACAAPGSKTAQIIEMLQIGSDEGDIIGTRTPQSTGMVVANDVDNRRCYMLVHQSKRLHSPCFVICNHDAGLFPNFEMNSSSGTELLKFDRILCDVPCTGDGTIRKNIDVWRKWSIQNGNNFHGMQVRIAKRSLELLSKDGIMVYSTCSLNPIEDEAVIATLLNQSQGSVELVDVFDKIKGLKFLPGLKKWTVMQKDKKVVTSVDEVDEIYRTQIRKSMFTPNNAELLHLDRCVRVLPHYQNTGGFFIAALRKTVDLLPWEAAKSEKVNQNEGESKVEGEGGEGGGGDDSEFPPSKRPRKFKGFREDPFYFFTEDTPEWILLKNFFKISDDFPVHQLVSRSTKTKRNIYFLSESARDMILKNEKKIKFINAGVRMFCRADDKVADCNYRIAQEGLPSILPYLDPELLICLDQDEIITLMKHEITFHELLRTETQEKLKTIRGGSSVVIHRKTDAGQNMLMAICVWKGKDTLRPFIAKSERIHFLRICGVDTVELEQEKIDAFKEKMQRKQARIDERNKGSDPPVAVEEKNAKIEEATKSVDDKGPLLV